MRYSLLFLFLFACGSDYTPKPRAFFKIKFPQKEYQTFSDNQLAFTFLYPKYSKVEIEKKIHNYDGIIIRSRFSIDKHFLQQASKLKFIGRVGAGLENIDCEFAKSKDIELIAAPEGNRNAVGEHALGMLLSLFNKLNKADKEVKKLYTQKFFKNLIVKKFVYFHNYQIPTTKT